MEYQESLSLSLIEKHRLSPKTNNVWKTRGKIPDRYKDGYTLEQRVGNLPFRRLKNVLCNEQLNLTVLSKLAGVSHSTICSITKGEVKSISKPNYSALKTEINRLRVDIKALIKVLEADRLHVNDYKELLHFIGHDPRKNLTNLIKNEKLREFCTDYRQVVLSVLLDKKALNFRCGLAVSMTQEDWTRYVDQLSIFLLETSL